jgi:uncharacterized protein (TIGR02265 family)
MTHPVSLTELKVKHLSFEAALKGTGALEDPTLLQEMKALYDVERPQASYSPETFQQFIGFLRQRLYPDLPEEEGLFKLGRASFQGYYKGTIVGRVALAAIHLMGPKRVVMLDRLWEDSGLGQAKTVKLGEHRYETSYNRFLLVPSAIAGVASESLIVAGAKNLRHQIKVLPSPVPYIYECKIIYEWD